jgi:hypothetical protein
MGHLVESADTSGPTIGGQPKRKRKNERGKPTKETQADRGTGCERGDAQTHAWLAGGGAGYETGSGEGEGEGLA